MSGFFLWPLGFVYFVCVERAFQNFKAQQRYSFYLIVMQSYMFFSHLVFLHTWNLYFYGYPISLAPFLE